MQIVGGGSRWLPGRGGPGQALDPAGEGGMGKAILSRGCRSITEVRAGAEAAGNVALGLGALAFGLAGKGCERSHGSVWPQGTHSLFRASQYRAGMKVT